MAVLIKNGLVYDGLGNPPERKDVLIRGQFIAKIGTLSRSHADEVIDAHSMYVTPGCIDVTSHSDHHYSLFNEPNQEDLLSQGITSIIGGNCGFSLAPLFGVLPDITTEWGSINGINVNWKTVKEFLGYFKEHPLGVNFGTLVGYTGLRRGTTKDRFRDLTDGELISIERMVDISIKEGALGVSFGLEHIHGMRTPFYEIERIARTVSRNKGICSIHMRDMREGIKKSVEESVSIAEKTGCGIHISHMQPLKKYNKQYIEALSYLSSHAHVTNIHFDINTFDTIPILLYELLPVWAQEESSKKMKENLCVDGFRTRLLEYIKKTAARDYVISHVPDRTLKFFEGKSMRELAMRAGVSYEEMIVNVMYATQFRATASVKIVDTDTIEQAVAHSQSVISSNSAAFGKKEFKQNQGTHTFPEFFSFVEKKKIIPMEKAVEKTSSIPAKEFGINKRGVISEGNYADIVLWSNNKPVQTFVNGLCAWSAEIGCNNVRNGTILESIKKQ
ncbi:hypothetical protein C4565_01785 [Candidatus Parcubacteria bacterium]|jgi:N-acyl-D-amino-acid deacylase|nr:MAG: hypothetical protein C4565_01785 [Candidatus Parcubacteria bacterium]